MHSIIWCLNPYLLVHYLTYLSHPILSSHTTIFLYCSLAVMKGRRVPSLLLLSAKIVLINTKEFSSTQRYMPLLFTLIVLKIQLTTSGNQPYYLLSLMMTVGMDAAMTRLRIAPIIHNQHHSILILFIDISLSLRFQRTSRKLHHTPLCPCTIITRTHDTIRTMIYSPILILKISVILTKIQNLNLGGIPTEMPRGLRIIIPHTAVNIWCHITRPWYINKCHIKHHTLVVTLLVVQIVILTKIPQCSTWNSHILIIHPKCHTIIIINIWVRTYHQTICNRTILTIWVRDHIHMQQLIRQSFPQHYSHHCRTVVSTRGKFYFWLFPIFCTDYHFLRASSCSVPYIFPDLSTCSFVIIFRFFSHFSPLSFFHYSKYELGSKQSNSFNRQ